jgi:SAM-dependent methyltransferase
MTESNYDDSWKSSKKNFYDQLRLNMRELVRSPPIHWQNFIDYINECKPQRIVDVGCGAGIYSTLCHYTKPNYGKDDDTNIEYIGYDYAEAAIEVANEAWTEGVVNDPRNRIILGDHVKTNCSFHVKGYEDITKEDIRDGDLLVANGLITVLSHDNAKKCFKHLMSLKCKHLLVQRQIITSSESYTTTYNAYDFITYLFHINKKELKTMAKEYNYDIELVKLGERTVDDINISCEYDILLELRD